jgi:protein-S-isoprenylcysteine O-methyltransferase Ste14
LFIILNFILIGFFILFIGFRRKIARLPASIYLAFIVALYIEMYGFPLTMYFFTWTLGSTSVSTLWYFLTIITGEQLFYSIFMGIIVPLSNIIIISGILLVIFGWSHVFRGKNTLVTNGIYKYVRHPQYLGFLLITLGMNVIWITLSTLVLWPALVFLYFKLAKEEDAILEQKFGKQFIDYKNEVPMFFPRLRS